MTSKPGPGTHLHSVIHQSGCSRPAFGSLGRTGTGCTARRTARSGSSSCGRLDLHPERRGDAAAVGRVRNAVPHGDGVGVGRQRELDVLARREFDRPAAGCLGGQRVRVATGDDLAVGGGVLASCSRKATDALRPATSAPGRRGPGDDRAGRGLAGDAGLAADEEADSAAAMAVDDAATMAHRRRPFDHLAVDPAMLRDIEDTLLGR